MTESEPTTSLTTRHLPDWSETRFIVLDPSAKWAPAIGLEIADHQKRGQNAVSRIHCESCSTTRDVLMLSEAANTVGLILFLRGMERDCLALLRRLPNLANRPAILVVCEQDHTELIPVMLESGVSCVLMDVQNDIPIAEWCQKIVDGRINRQTR